MKIVQFLASKGWGGLETIFVSLCNELAKVSEVDVIIFKDSEAIERFNKNVRIHVLRSNSNRLNPLLYIELYRLLKSLDPDIVHTHGAKATIMVHKLSQLMHIDHVATKHNSRIGKIFNKIKNVIAVSEGVKKSILHDNVEVIYNGVNLVEVGTQDDNEKFTILAVGRLDKVKGFDILIRECNKLEFPFTLEIVGEGIEKINLQKEIDKLSLESKVRLLGFRRDIPQLMKKANVVVMSSHNEGFSLVMVESLFYSKVFISTKVSGVKEVLDNEFIIDDFKIANKIIDIYLNYEKYQKDFFKLQKRVQNHFILHRMIEKHVDYYHRVLNA